MDRRARTRPPPTDGEDDRARKRRKQSVAGQQNGSDAGLAAARELFDEVWDYQERNRFIRQHFETLPSKDVYPDYYVKIKRPISLHEIKVKLDAYQYASGEEFKNDLLLMCDNAATYNKSKSQVHSDSIRIRNLVSKFLPSAYANGRRQDSVQVAEAPTPTRNAKGAKDAGNFAQKLQQTQLQIVEDMINLTNDDGISISHYFQSLPSKKLTDYYRLIKEPISLNGMKKRIKEGRYPHWADFEQAFLQIRKNAEEYNDEASELVRDARLMEQAFYKRYNDEKVKLPDAVPQSSGIKLRLNVGGHHSTPQVSTQNHQQSVPASALPKINLKVKNRQNTPRSATPAAASPASQPNVPVDQPPPSASPPLVVKDEPNQSQAVNPQALVNVPEVTNGNYPVTTNGAPSMPEVSPQPTPKPVVQPSTTVSTASVYTPAPALTSASPPKSTSGVNGFQGAAVPLKAEASPMPRLQVSPPAVNPAMPPPPQRLNSLPLETPRPASYSPIPRSHVSPQPVSVPEFTRSRPAYSYSEPTLRAEGMDASSAYMTNLRITSSTPTSDYTRDFKPHDRKVTAQYYVHPPAEHTVLTLIPTLSPEILARPYNLTVHHKISGYQTKLIPISAARQKRKDEPPFDVQLTPAITNTVEVTIVTKTPDGQKGAGIGGWEMERFRLFIYVI